MVEIFLPADRNTGRPRGFAFVELGDDEAAAEAIEKLDGYDLNGRNLRVTIAEDRPRRSPGQSDDGPSHRNAGQKKSRPKGSRRNVRGKKRSL